MDFALGVLADAASPATSTDARTLLWLSGISACVALGTGAMALYGQLRKLKADPSAPAALNADGNYTAKYVKDLEDQRADLRIELAQQQKAHEQQMNELQQQFQEAISRNETLEVQHIRDEATHMTLEARLRQAGITP